MPVTRSMSSASTQCAAPGWYSKRVPGSQLSRHFAKRSSRPSRVAQSRGPIGAVGKPEVWVSSCSTVTTSLPLVANSGIRSPARVSSFSDPSASSCHTAPAVSALVQENIGSGRRPAGPPPAGRRWSRRGSPRRRAPAPAGRTGAGRRRPPGGLERRGRHRSKKKKKGPWRQRRPRRPLLTGRQVDATLGRDAEGDMADDLHRGTYMADLLLHAARIEPRRAVRPHRRPGPDRRRRARRDQPLRPGLPGRGIERGSPVSVLSPNRPEVLFAMGANMVTGCRTTPLHPLGSLDDHAYVLDDAGIETLVFDPRVRRAGRRAARAGARPAAAGASARRESATDLSRSPRSSSPSRWSRRRSTPTTCRAWPTPAAPPASRRASWAPTAAARR